MSFSGPVFLYPLYDGSCSLPAILHKTEDKIKMVFKGGKLSWESNSFTPSRSGVRAPHHPPFLYVHNLLKNYNIIYVRSDIYLSDGLFIW